MPSKDLEFGGSLYLIWTYLNIMKHNVHSQDEKVGMGSKGNLVVCEFLEAARGWNWSLRFSFSCRFIVGSFDGAKKIAGDPKSFKGEHLVPPAHFIKGFSPRLRKLTWVFPLPCSQTSVNLLLQNNGSTADICTFPKTKLSCNDVLLESFRQTWLKDGCKNLEIIFSRNWTVNFKVFVVSFLARACNVCRYELIWDLFNVP